MILLKDILYRVGIEQVVGSTAVAVRGVEFDSRRVALNDVFVAIKGVLVDGHQFIKQACDQGAIAIICEQPVPVEAPAAEPVPADAPTEVAAAH